MSSSFIETGLSVQASLIHRALASLQEELEAIDLYHQRQDVTTDAPLKAVLNHNRNDEMEHAAMLLEWLRLALPDLDLQLRRFLFQPAEAADAAAGKDAPGAGLGLGASR